MKWKDRNTVIRRKFEPYTWMPKNLETKSNINKGKITYKRYKKKKNMNILFRPKYQSFGSLWGYTSACPKKVGEANPSLKKRTITDLRSVMLITLSRLDAICILFADIKPVLLD